MEDQTPSSPSPEPIIPRGIRLIYHADAGAYLFMSVGEVVLRPDNNVGCGYAVLARALNVDIDTVRDSSPRSDVLRVRTRDHHAQRLRTTDLSYMAQVWQRVICAYSKSSTATPPSSCTEASTTTASPRPFLGADRAFEVLTHSAKLPSGFIKSRFYAFVGGFALAAAMPEVTEEANDLVKRMDEGEPVLVKHIPLLAQAMQRVLPVFFAGDASQSSSYVPATLAHEQDNWDAPIGLFIPWR